jgi:hypothetical protein
LIEYAVDAGAVHRHAPVDHDVLAGDEPGQVRAQEDVRQIARPMPEPPPVTTTRCPSNNPTAAHGNGHIWPRCEAPPTRLGLRVDDAEVVASGSRIHVCASNVSRTDAPRSSSRRTSLTRSSVRTSRWRGFFATGGGVNLLEADLEVRAVDDDERVRLGRVAKSGQSVGLGVVVNAGLLVC